MQRISNDGCDGGPDAADGGIPTPGDHVQAVRGACANGGIFESLQARRVTATEPPHFPAAPPSKAGSTPRPLPPRAAPSCCAPQGAVPRPRPAPRQGRRLSAPVRAGGALGGRQAAPVDRSYAVNDGIVSTQVRPLSKDRQEAAVCCVALRCPHRNAPPPPATACRQPCGGDPTVRQAELRGTRPHMGRSQHDAQLRRGSAYEAIGRGRAAAYLCHAVRTRRRTCGAHAAWHA